MHEIRYRMADGLRPQKIPFIFIRTLAGSEPELEQ